MKCYWGKAPNPREAHGLHSSMHLGEGGGNLVMHKVCTTSLHVRLKLFFFDNISIKDFYACSRLVFESVRPLEAREVSSAE